METGWTRGVVTVELLEPAGRARGGVLVVHSWWGLTDSFRRYGAALAAEGYRVGLADLFGGATATTEDEARALRAARRPRPDYRTLSAGLDAVRGAAAEQAIFWTRRQLENPATPDASRKRLEYLARLPRTIADWIPSARGYWERMTSTAASIANPFSMLRKNASSASLTSRSSPTPTFIKSGSCSKS